MDSWPHGQAGESSNEPVQESQGHGEMLSGLEQAGGTRPPPPLTAGGDRSIPWLVVPISSPSGFRPGSACAPSPSLALVAPPAGPSLKPNMQGSISPSRPAQGTLGDVFWVPNLDSLSAASGFSSPRPGCHRSRLSPTVAPWRCHVGLAACRRGRRWHLRAQNKSGRGGGAPDLPARIGFERRYFGRSVGRN